MSTSPPPEIALSCPCGWRGQFAASYAGLQIECPQCGKGHRLAMFGAPGTTVDMSTLEKLLHPYSEPGSPAAPGSRLAFKPLFLLSLVFALLVCAVSLPLLWNHWPVNAAVAGGALSWPLAIAVAWLGNARQRRHS